MNNVAFERLLSFHPKLNDNKFTSVCLRDMIYQHYLTIWRDEVKADECTKDYIAKLWEKVK